MAKMWKQVLVAILVIACLINIIFKLATKVAVSEELKLSAVYLKDSVQEKVTNVGTNIQNKVGDVLKTK